MKVNTGRTGRGSALTLPVLMVAVFTVSVGYGVVLPRLPRLIERPLGPGVEAAQVSWHTGLLTAAFTASLFLFAPLWGRLADRRLGEEFSGDQVAAANVRSAMGERWPFVKRSDVWPTTSSDSLVTIGTLR